MGYLSLIIGFSSIFDEGQLLQSWLMVSSVRANYWVSYCKTKAATKGRKMGKKGLFAHLLWCKFLLPVRICQNNIIVCICKAMGAAA